MPPDAGQPATAPATRAEKLSVLSALLGPEVVARLRQDRLSEPPEDVEIDADRAAWHKNRLLERLRAKTSSTPDSAEAAAKPATPVSSASAPLSNRPARDSASMDSRLASNLQPGLLGAEHPAVITRLLSNLDRPARVETLKSLPGPVARTVLRRLRDL